MVWCRVHKNKILCLLSQVLLYVCLLSCKKKILSGHTGVMYLSIILIEDMAFGVVLAYLGNRHLCFLKCVTLHNVLKGH